MTAQSKKSINEININELFEELGKVKSKIIRHLASEGYTKPEIAKTLLKEGILSPKSYRQHVNNVLNQPIVEVNQEEE